MKRKILTLFIILISLSIMLFILTGCTNNTIEEVDTSEEGNVLEQDSISNTILDDLQSALLDYVEEENLNNNESQSTVPNQGQMTAQEIDAFNNQFTPYEGSRTGSQVKALMGVLISNVNTYKDSGYERIPGFYIDVVNKEGSVANMNLVVGGEEDYSEYINALGKIRSSIESKHKYFVEITMQPSGLIGYINISYDENNKVIPLNK